jgi:hypothetical protein
MRGTEDTPYRIVHERATKSHEFLCIFWGMKKAQAVGNLFARRLD